MYSLLFFFTQNNLVYLNLINLHNSFSFRTFLNFFHQVVSTNRSLCFEQVCSIVGRRMNQHICFRYFISATKHVKFLKVKIKKNYAKLGLIYGHGTNDGVWANRERWWDVLKLSWKQNFDEKHFSRILENFPDQRKVGKRPAELVVPRADQEVDRWVGLDIVRAKAEDPAGLSNFNPAFKQCDEVKFWFSN